MFRKIITLLIFLSLIVTTNGQIKTDKKLQEKVVQLLNGFNGTVGVYAKNLRTNYTISINADTVFPTASMIKVPILIGMMDKIEKGEITYHQSITYKDSLLYEGEEDILGSFKNNEKIDLAKVMMLMLTTSDNTASLWLQSLAGGGLRINELLDSMGMTYTRVNSRTMGREPNKKMFGWGQTTPFEMCELFEKIYRGELISKKASERMLRVLGRNYWDQEAISQIPPTVFVASKNGAVDASRSETMLVMAPTGPYIFSIITKNQTDTGWGENNEGWVLARKLSALLWQYYNPTSKWQPSQNSTNK